MIPYYGLILWTGILYGGIKHVRLKDKKKTFVCLAFLSTVLLQSLRAEYVGGDMVQYLRGYTASARGGWLDPVFNFELIFRILIHTLAVFHVPRQGFIAIMSVLCQAPVFYFFYKRAKNPCLSILIYFTFGLFTFSFSGIRRTSNDHNIAFNSQLFSFFLQLIAFICFYLKWVCIFIQTPA